MSSPGELAQSLVGGLLIEVCVACMCVSSCAPVEEHADNIGYNQAIRTYHIADIHLLPEISERQCKVESSRSMRVVSGRITD